MKDPPHQRHRIDQALLFFAAAFLFFNVFAFGWRPDPLTLWTILPAWIPLMSVLALVGVVMLRRKLASRMMKMAGLLFVCAVLVLFMFSEESRSFFNRNSQAGSIRLVSLNWGGAGRQPLKDLELLQPDLILIQESPRREILEDWCRSRRLHLAWSPEASVISTSPLERLHFDTEHVRVRWLQRDIVSLRLPPPIFRFDVWNPRCWTRYAERRRLRRETLARLTATKPTILGGDFNCPAGDGALSPLRSNYVDAYANKGSGFPNTAPTYLPLHRIDQVWVDNSLQVRTCRRVKISGSDHYGVMTTLEVVQSTGSSADDKPV